MKILIVEDDEAKRVQLIAFLKGLNISADLRLARSLQSGLRLLKEERPDLIVLDMTLPNYDAGPDESGGEHHPLGGRQFMSQMDRFDMGVPVVVVTQFETFGKGPELMNLADLDKRLKREFPSIYLGSVYYHAAIHGWKQDLERLVLSSIAPERGEQNG